MRRIVAASCVLVAGLGVQGLAAGQALAGATVTIAVSANPQVGKALTVSGDVSGVQGTTTVTLQRDHSPEMKATSTDVNGHYEFTDTPDTRGAVTYTVTVEGVGSSAMQTVQVAGKPPGMSLAVDKSVVTTGHSVHVTAHLGGPAGGRVTIYAKPYRRDRRQLASGNVGPNGNLATNATLGRRTTLIAHFNGDQAYAPATVQRVVRVRALITENLRREYGHASGFALYRVDVNPAVLARLRPARKGRCLHFRAQRHYGGGWHTSAVSGCVRTDAHGLALGVLTGDHVLGQRYRLRAEWRGNKALLAHNGAWLKLEFRR
ncbi:MAG: hypothetical protein QOJ03_705 [Frankiaceae bacterium]|jgi:hypothetical protein|nr:hypothetical protein [Frankiaceae bacterium]